MIKKLYISNNYNAFLMLLISIIMCTSTLSFAQTRSDDMDRESTIYTIYNVEVDETSRNVATARDRALRKGQRSGLELLFRRILLSDDRKKLPTFKDNEVLEFVSGFEINNERRSSVRYIASLVVHFNRSKINEVLSFYKIPYAETLGTAVSVLPVLDQGGAMMLWEKNNVWREAWQNYDVINNLVPINTPRPTLKNRMYISAQQAKTGHQRSIQAFIRENRLNDLIVAFATMGKDVVTDTLTLDIELKQNRLNIEDDNNAVLRVSVPALNEDGLPNYDALYKAGIEAATDWVDDLWKSKVLVSYGAASSITARGTLTEINDWLIMQKQLSKVNLVRNVNLNSITIDAVDLEIEFAGDEEQLALSLAQQGLTLEQNEDDQGWDISLTNRSSDQGQFR